MKDLFVFARNRIIKFFYKYVLKPFFFLFDPEKIHDSMTSVGRWLGRSFFLRWLTKLAFGYSNPALSQNLLGIHFKNPVGLGAGFDKNAELTDIMPSVGFGFEEVGSITGEQCEGNPKPRLWRLKKSKALIVNYGLKNDGCIMIAERLRRKNFKFPVGISIAKTNSPATCETGQGIEDYVKAFREFTHIGDYFTVNISCPNAYGGQPFTDPSKLKKLLDALDRIPTSKPIFLKFSPDITKKNLDEILQIATQHRIDGFICTNLTKPRENKKIVEKNIPKTGGISGKVVEELSNEMISYLYQKTKGKYVIIGLGGIFNAEDAYKKIKLGASLVQLVTGMIFEGPELISDINLGLAKLLKKDGFENISEAVGVDNQLI